MPRRALVSFLLIREPRRNSQRAQNNGATKAAAETRQHDRLSAAGVAVNTVTTTLSIKS